MSHNGKSEDLIFRTIRPADIPHLAELETRAFADGWSAAALAPTLDAATAVGRLVEDSQRGEILAYALFQRVLDEAELLRIAVDPRSQNQGVGRRLLSHALGRLADGGVRRCRLEVDTANASAIALYRRLGFVDDGLRRGYYRHGGDARLMRLDPLPGTTFTAP